MMAVEEKKERESDYGGESGINFYGLPLQQ
jgi:hypothetical protein